MEWNVTINEEGPTSVRRVEVRRGRRRLLGGSRQCARHGRATADGTVTGRVVPSVTTGSSTSERGR